MMALIKTIATLEKPMIMARVVKEAGINHKMLDDILKGRSDLIKTKYEGRRTYLSRTEKADKAAPVCKAFVVDYINDIEKYFIERCD